VAALYPESPTLDLRKLPAKIGAYVYRCYDAEDVLLYIGSTRNPRKRLDQHATNNAVWFARCVRIDCQSCAEMAEARQVESQAIQRENPVYNRLGFGVSIAEAVAPHPIAVQSGGVLFGLRDRRREAVRFRLRIWFDPVHSDVLLDSDEELRAPANARAQPAPNHPPQSFIRRAEFGLLVAELAEVYPDVIVFLELYYVRDFNVKRIAELLGRGADTVSAGIARAVDWLVEHLWPAGGNG
jgi:predicted GIY-YIG superfamily endonuclease